MHTEPIIRADIRRNLDSSFLSANETPITVVTFTPSIDAKRPIEAIRKENAAILAWCRQYAISPASGMRRVGTQRLQVINQIVLTPEQAADIIGGDYPAMLHEARRRREQVEFFELEDEKHHAVMKQTMKLSPEIFDGIVMIAHYIREHPGLNIHQRTIHLPGIDTKFVERHRPQIELLLNEGEFKLKDHRSVEIIVCYRDPDHMAASSRRCDVIIPGYSDTPFEYVPKTIVVCENKHSAMFMAPREGLITMMGVGYSASARMMTELRIAHHPHLIYWGDIDLEGLAILANTRKAGLQITSICMDAHTARKYKNYDVIPQHTSKIEINPVFLTEAERGALRMLKSGQIHRIEQEKLPENYVSHQLDLALGTKVCSS